MDIVINGNKWLLYVLILKEMIILCINVNK